MTRGIFSRLKTGSIPEMARAHPSNRMKQPEGIPQYQIQDKSRQKGVRNMNFHNLMTTVAG